MKDTLKRILDRMFLRADLANHAVWGTFLYWAGSWAASIVGLLLAIIFALVKDLIIDKKMGLGQYDPKDIFWTVLLPVLLFIQDMRGLEWIQ